MMKAKLYEIKRSNLEVQILVHYTLQQAYLDVDAAVQANTDEHVNAHLDKCKARLEEANKELKELITEQGQDDYED